MAPEHIAESLGVLLLESDVRVVARAASLLVLGAASRGEALKAPPADGRTSVAYFDR